MGKRIRNWLLMVPALLISMVTMAQQNNEPPQMADGLRSNGKIFVVVTVLIVILLGIVLYLVRLDRKITKLEKENK